MAYVRSKAVDYARRYWNQPCADGTFWFADTEIMVARKRRDLKALEKDGWIARFVDDGSGGEEAVFLRANAAGKSIPNLTGKCDPILIAPSAGLADCAHFLSDCLTHGGLTGIRTP